MKFTFSVCFRKVHIAAANEPYADQANFTIPGNRITVLKIAFESLYWWIRNENKQTTFFRSDSRSWLSLRMLQTFAKLQYLKLWCILCLQATVPLIFAINSKVNRSKSNYVMIVLESNKGKRRRALQFWRSRTRQRHKSAAIYCLYKFRLPALDGIKSSSTTMGNLHGNVFR